LVSPALLVPSVLRAPAALSVLEASPARRAATVPEGVQATPAKLVSRAQSVLPVNLAPLVSRATLAPLALPADPVFVEKLAPAVLLAQVDPPVRWDLLGRPAILALLVHAVPTALMDLVAL